MSESSPFSIDEGLAIAVLARHLHETRRAKVWIAIYQGPPVQFSIQIDLDGLKLGRVIEGSNLSRFHDIPRGVADPELNTIHPVFISLAEREISKIIEKHLHEYIQEKPELTEAIWGGLGPK